MVNVFWLFFLIQKEHLKCSYTIIICNKIIWHWRRIVIVRLKLINIITIIIKLLTQQSDIPIKRDFWFSTFSKNSFFILLRTCLRIIYSICVGSLILLIKLKRRRLMFFILHFFFHRPIFLGFRHYLHCEYQFYNGIIIDRCE